MRLAKITLVPLIALSLVSASSPSSATPRKLNQTLTAAVYSEDPVPDGVPVEKAPSKGDQLIQAALAQLGAAQDCTDLVQNSLATLGLTTRRDQGGFDYGVNNVAYEFGYEVHWSEARPGDIATRGPNNGGHVWIVLNPETGEGIHGGWNGTTVIAVEGVPLSSHAVYRLRG